MRLCSAWLTILVDDCVGMNVQGCLVVVGCCWMLHGIVSWSVGVGWIGLESGCASQFGCCCFCWYSCSSVVVIWWIWRYRCITTERASVEFLRLRAYALFQCQLQMSALQHVRSTQAVWKRQGGAHREKHETIKWKIIYPT